MVIAAKGTYMGALDRQGSGPARAAWAALRLAGALLLLTVFAMSAMGVWFFIAVFIGLSLDENAIEGGPSTVTSRESALAYGAASLAAVAVVVPGLAFAWRLVRPR